MKPPHQHEGTQAMKAVIDIKNDSVRRTVLIVTLPIYPVAVLLVALWFALGDVWDEVVDTPAAFKNVWKGRTR